MKITKIPVAYRKLISAGLTHRISMWCGFDDYAEYNHIRNFLQDHCTYGWKTFQARRKIQRRLHIYISEEILTLLLLNGMNNEDY